MKPPLCTFPALTFVLGSLLPTLTTLLKFYLVLLKFLQFPEGALSSLLHLLMTEEAAV